MSSYEENEFSSHLLPHIIEYLSQEEKMRERLASIGVQLQRRNGPAHCTSPEDIDLFKLKERSATTAQKTIFREFNNIYSTIQQLVK